VSTKMAVFWVVAPCSLVLAAWVLIALMIEAARSSETFVNLYQITRRYNPEDSHLPNRRFISVLENPATGFSPQSSESSPHPCPF
jgi:hypothetical protein